MSETNFITKPQETLCRVLMMELACTPSC